MPPQGRPRALTMLAGVILGLCAVAVMPAGAATAHAAQIATAPAAGSVVATAPATVVITFDEHVGVVRSDIVVIGPDRRRIDTGAAVSIDDQVRIPVRTDVVEGTFLVSYRVISADSHPITGGFSYSVGAPSPGGAPPSPVNDATDPVVSVAVSVAQILGFAGLCLVVGPTLVLLALWPRRLARTVPIRAVHTGLWLIGGAAACGIYLEAPYGAGTSLFGASGADISAVLDSAFGRSLMLRLAIVIITGFVIRPVLAGRGTRIDHALLGVLGLVGIGTWAYAGHPAHSDVPPLTVIADIAHLASAAVWLGGLVILAGVLLRQANARELAVILPVWSNWATIAVLALVLGGTAQALIEIGSISVLTHTWYGQLVLIKVALLIVILAFAAGARDLVQRHAVAPRAHAGDAAPTGAIGGEPEPVGMYQPQVTRLRQSVFAELGIGLAVLIVTGFLVQSSPTPQPAATSGPGGPISLRSSLYTLRVDFRAGGGSGTDLDIAAVAPAGGPQPVAQMTIVATLPSEHLSESLAATRITDTHWTATASVPVPGDWTFTFTVRTTAIDEASVSTTEHIG